VGKKNGGGVARKGGRKVEGGADIRREGYGGHDVATAGYGIGHGAGYRGGWGAGYV
jgi:hypothetical protein